MVPTEQEILQDGLCATKYLMHMCAKNQIEGSTPELRGLFDACYKTAAEQNFKIFELMQEKGYYEVTPADEEQIDMALETHEEMQENLEDKFN